MRTLILTRLCFQRYGNQVLRNFVEGLLESGSNVCVLTTGLPSQEDSLVGCTYRGKLRIVNAWSPLRALKLVFQRVLTNAGRTRNLTQSRRPTLNVPGIWDEVPIVADPGWRLIPWWCYQQLLFLFYGALLVLTYKPDVIVGYEIHAAWAAVVLGKVFRRRCVTRFQGTGLHYWLRRGRLPLGLRPHVWATSAKADLVIMANDGTRGNLVCGRLGHPMERVWFAPEGINTEDNLSREHDPGSLPTSGDYLVWVSKMKHWKRLDRGLALFDAIAKAFPGELGFVVIGDGPYLPVWQERTRTLPCAENVHFLGGLEHALTCRVISGARALISTQDGTNLSMAVQEAIVRRVPVISIDDGSLDGLLDFSSCLLVRWGGDLASEGARIANALCDREILREITQRAYESFQKFGCSERQRKMEEARKVRGT